MRLLPRYGMLLWTKQIHNPADIILEMNKFLQNYGDDFCPVICDDQKIELEQKALEGFVAEYRLLNDFGFFHTVLKAANGLHFSLTMDRPKELSLSEVLSIQFDTHHLEGDKPSFTFERLYQLFVFGINLFQPFWGEIDDSKQSSDSHSIMLKIDAKKIPMAIYWFNYFDEAMVERLGGQEKLLAAPAYLVEPVSQTNGYLLILQRETFDYHNPEHRHRQQSIEDYFGLKALHELYPKPRKEWWKSGRHPKE